MKKLPVFFALFMCISSATAQNHVIHDFNTSNQLATFFFNNDGVSDVSQVPTDGIGGSGSLQLITRASGGVFVNKQGYGNGGDGSVYELSAYLKSANNSGYGGLGFTGAQNSNFSRNAAPASGIGISVHGGGYEYNNDSTNTSGDWRSANVTQSTIFDLLNRGSPDQWYFLSLKLTDLPGNDFELLTSVWSVNSDGSRIRAEPDAVDRQSFTNLTMASASVIYSYFAYGDHRLHNIDNYSFSFTAPPKVDHSTPSLTASLEFDPKIWNQINASANLLSIGSSEIIERGFVYSTSPNPTISNTKLIVACSQSPCIGIFESAIPSLSDNIYYVRAFATNSAGTGYSLESAITISKASAEERMNRLLLPSPINKKDVINSIETWVSGTNQVAHTAINRVGNRLDFLERLPKEKVENSSSQGIDIRFANPRLQRLFAAPAKGRLQEPEQIAIKAFNVLAQSQGSNGRLVAEAESALLNRIAIAREESLGKISPTFESNSNLGDWSWWTMGTIMVGKHGERLDSPGFRMHADYLTLGLDRFSEHLGVIGASVMLGQNDYDIGNLGSKLYNNSSSLMLYNSYPLSERFSIRSIVGGSDFDLKTGRADGNEFLVGKRTAQQAFLSVELRHRGLRFNSVHPLDMELYMKADLVDTKIKQFAEEGGKLALLFEEQKVKNRRVGLGFDLKSKFKLGQRQAIPYFGLEYAANINPLTNADMRYVSETRMYRHTMQRSVNSDWKVDFGIDLDIGDLRLGLSYERTHQRNNGYSNTINLKVNGPF